MLGANPLPSNEEDTDEFNGTTTLQPVDESSLLTTTTMESPLAYNESVNSNGTQVEEFVCAFYNPDFIIYSSLGSFYIPCVIMVFLYIRIFSVSILILFKTRAESRTDFSRLRLSSQCYFLDISIQL